MMNTYGMYERSEPPIVRKLTPSVILFCLACVFIPVVLLASSTAATLFVFLFELTVICTVIISAVVIPCRFALRMPASWAWLRSPIAVVCIAACVLVLMAFHLHMARLVDPVFEKFTASASCDTSAPSISYDETTLPERDRIVEAHGYVRIGGWFIRHCSSPDASDSIVNSALYLRVPWR